MYISFPPTRGEVLYGFSTLSRIDFKVDFFYCIFERGTKRVLILGESKLGSHKQHLRFE